MHHYSIHGLVTVSSNVETNIPGYFRTGSVENPDVTIVEGPIETTVTREEKKQRAGYAVWEQDGRLVIDYEVFNLKVSIGNLGNDIDIRCTERFTDRRSGHINTLAKLAIQLKLVEAGHTFIHAGSVATDDRAVLIPALGSTGKTYTTLALVNGHETYFMSDDLSIVGRNGTLYSYPTPVNPGPYELNHDTVPEFDVQPSLASRFANVPIGSILLERFPWTARSNSIDPPERVIQDSAEIGSVCLITHGLGGQAERISSSEAMRRTLVQHFDTHHIFGSYILNYYSYLFDLDLTGRVHDMRDIVSAAFEDVDCYELQSNELSQYPELIRNVIGLT